MSEPNNSKRDKCPTCGSIVVIHSGDDGTGCYLPFDGDLKQELTTCQEKLELERRINKVIDDSNVDARGQLLIAQQRLAIAEEALMVIRIREDTHTPCYKTATKALEKIGN